MSSKPDYLLKSNLINSQCYLDYVKWSKLNYKLTYSGEFVSDEDYKLANQLMYYWCSKDKKAWKECSKISHANYSRVKRLKDKISSILFNGSCLFLTLTFNNNSLNYLSSSVRKEYVKEYLRSLDCDYVANIDFGKKNGREHYHAVVAIDNVDYSKWRYGAINGIKIRNNTEDITRIAKYVSKLVNHAIKATTKRCAIIYSRRK